MICPHCHTEVSKGASVCIGCQAEIEYGAPNYPFLVALVISIFAGFKVAGFVPEWLSWIGWIVGIGLFVASCTFIVGRFEKRVIFKRIYRTK